MAERSISRDESTERAIASVVAVSQYRSGHCSDCDFEPEELAWQHDCPRSCELQQQLTASREQQLAIAPEAIAPEEGWLTPLWQPQVAAIDRCTGSKRIASSAKVFVVCVTNRFMINPLIIQWSTAIDRISRYRPFGGERSTKPNLLSSLLIRLVYVYRQPPVHVNVNFVKIISTRRKKISIPASLI